MPKYEVELSDGRKFEVEADGPPSEQDVMTHIGMASKSDDRSWFSKKFEEYSKPLLPESGLDLLPKFASDAIKHHNQEQQVQAADYLGPNAAWAIAAAQDFNPLAIAYGAAQRNSSPVAIAENLGMATGVGEASKAARLVGGLASAARAGQGLERAADTKASLSERGMGALDVLLGGLGVHGASRGPLHAPAATPLEDVSELAGGHSTFDEAANAVRPTVDPMPAPAGEPAPPMPWAERARYAEAEGFDIPSDRLATEAPPEAVAAQAQADALAREEAFKARAREVQAAQARQPKARDLMAEYGARGAEEATDLFGPQSHSGMGEFRQGQDVPYVPSQGTNARQLTPVDFAPQDYALNLTGDRALSEGEIEGINSLGTLMEGRPLRGNGLADDLDRPIGPMVEKAYVNPRPGEVMAGPRDLTQMSAGEEEGIRRLGEVQDFMYGPDAPTRGNGQWNSQRGAADAQVLARMGLGAGGAAYGFATGDDTQSRLERAAIFGTAGALAPSLLARPQTTEALLDGMARGKNLSRVEGLSDVLERGGKPSPSPVAKGVPPSVAGDASRAEAFIDRHVPLKNPDDLNLAKQILADNDNFYRQRRMSQSWAQTERAADDLAVDDLKKMLPRGTTLNAEQTEAYRRASMGAIGEAQEAVSALREAGDQATDSMRQDVAERMMKAVAGLSSMFGTRSEAGRALNIYKKFAVARRQGDVEFVRKALDLGFGKEEVANRLLELSGDPVKQMQWLRSMAQPKFGDYWRWFMLSNVLSGPKTQIRNIGGNTSQLATGIAGRAITELGSSVVGQFHNGPRLVAPGETMAAAEGAVKGFKQAYKNALHMFNTGFSLEDAANLKDLPKEVFNGRAANIVSRSMGAMDQFFQGLNFSSELYALARNKAYNEGLRGAELIKRSEELVSQPTTELVEQAKKFAQSAVFRSPGGEMQQGVKRVVRGADNLTAKPAALVAEKLAPVLGKKNADFVGQVLSVPIGTAVMPFVATPANIIKHGAKLHGGGFVSGAYKLAQGQGREAMHDIGEAGVGAAFLGMAALWAAQGKMTGAAPSDPKEREKWYAEGKRPNAIKIGNKWVGYNVLGPLAMPLSTVANAYDVHRETGKFDPLMFGAQTLKATMDQSFLAGMQGLLEAVEEPWRYDDDGNRVHPALDRFAGNIAGSFLVPASGLMRGMRQAVDPSVRAPEGFMENIQNTIPGLSQNITPRLNANGEVPQLPAGLTGSGIERIISPLDVSDSTPDPARDAMKEVGVFYPSPSQKLHGYNLSKDEGVELGQVMGRFQTEAVKSIVGSHAFYQMSPEQRRQLLQKVISDSRAQVREMAKSRFAANTERP